jgi:hypothetical protein
MTVNIQIESTEPQRTAIAEERVVLNNISWETFERLLVEAGDNRNTRFHYLDGMLEIMSPLSRHEGSNRFIESLISAIAEELDLNLRKLGSLTMKRRDRQAEYYSLQDGTYRPVDRSPTFPWLPSAVILEYLEKRFEIGETKAVRHFRAWVGQQDSGRDEGITR